MFIDKILDYFNYIDVKYVGLILARIYDEKVVQNEDKAVKYYIDKGFKPISGQVGENLVMGKSLL